MLIKDKRLSLGLTQEELAQKVGVQRTTVTMWENGEAYPRADKLVKLSKLFGCSIDELMTDASGIMPE
ncbi:MAG: helix-turn-helix transcriptional regulator [Clostridia bacterium]|nr:helix-turn-helix transcriptional regulator [Clostridia bacterium]